MQRARIEISKPRKFGVVSILAKYAFSFLLVLPALSVLLIVSTKHLGLCTIGISLLTLVGTVFFLPSLGNIYVCWILRHDIPQSNDDKLIVQITLCPRIRTGFRALIEDADDVGYLSLDESELIFLGDSVNLIVPFQRIKAVQGENVGMRGLYVAAGRIRLDISDLDGFEGVEIAERNSRMLPTSRRITRELFYTIKSRSSRGLAAPESDEGG